MILIWELIRGIIVALDALFDGCDELCLREKMKCHVSISKSFLSQPNHIHKRHTCKCLIKKKSNLHCKLRNRQKPKKNFICSIMTFDNYDKWSYNDERTFKESLILQREPKFELECSCWDTRSFTQWDYFEHSHSWCYWSTKPCT